MAVMDQQLMLYEQTNGIVFGQFFLTECVFTNINSELTTEFYTMPAMFTRGVVVKVCVDTLTKNQPTQIQS